MDTKGRWTPHKTARTQSELFTVRCCLCEPQADEPPPTYYHMK